MNNISDLIERYLKKMLAESIQDFIEVQRSELANRFNCVPSQINYVLTTRFSTGRGYIVESRRGGGGFIRIVKVPLDQRVDLILDISNMIGDSISQNEAAGLIRRLLEEELITKREARLMLSAMDGSILRLNLPARDQLRAMILKAMVVAVLRE
ncbi:MAG: Transcriptional regulator CtsR [Pelotomaculum sp. PtaB.Bin013]|uniref:Transcriptional regulator CtsR n=1 Tax=Pelotomaculum isophthalicicum JI TaxID=947010 RepID=A0A9X4JTP5_9FIRM|nr:CtsR family transcriptional regulator [Pelotomaculum isophthalicicum]MDF9407735.1 CtsR family transcriptional regulator [Pelotomaculum isophthalicicum JI]OPX88704.1 MAG: Transcriptional regulator CtsR [Pelotomaculum sp. PtaB.Bin013]